MADAISQASAILVTNRTYSASSSNLDDTTYINWCSKRIKNLLDPPHLRTKEDVALTFMYYDGNYGKNFVCTTS